MTTTTGTCWADPLTRAERTELAARLARACKRLHHNRDFPLPSHVYGVSCMEDARRAGLYTAASAEMSDLHLDVTERAAPPEAAERQEADAGRIIARMKLFTGPDDLLGLEG